MLKLVFSEAWVLKWLISFYLVIFISLYIVISVLFNISVSVDDYTDDMVNKVTEGLVFDVTFNYRKDTDLSEFAGDIAYGDKILIYGDSVLANAVITDGVHETDPVNGTATSFIYGLRGITKARPSVFIRSGGHPDLLDAENNDGKLWISDKLSACELKTGSEVRLLSSQFKEEHKLKLAGIFDSRYCDSDYLISYNSCYEILDSEGYSTRSQVTLPAADYNRCGRMLSRLHELEIDEDCYFYDLIKEQINVVRMVMWGLMCICLVTAVSSAFISYSMSNMIILRRDHSIAMYKVLGLSAGRLKLIYLIITEGLVAISCGAAFYPARRLTRLLADEYCGLFGLKDLKLVSSVRTFPMILLLCSVFTLAGFLKVFSAIDKSSELEIVRNDR